MINYYKKKPLKCVLILFVIGIIFLLVAGTIYWNVPERIHRSISFDKDIETSEGKYIGGLKHGTIDGEGYFIWDTGDKYIGLFSDNEIKGKGKFTFANGVPRKILCT